jgi:ABC-type tungstate transport system substrate-binding protein
VPAAALVFWWLRKGNVRGAVSLVLAAFVVHFSAELVLLGLFSRRNSLAAILFVFVFAGLVVGRRTLWLLFVSMVVALIAGALRDIPEYDRAARLTGTTRERVIGTRLGEVAPAVTAAAEPAAVPPSLAEQVKLALGGTGGPANRLEGPGSGLPGPRAVPAPPTQPGQPPS